MKMQLGKTIALVTLVFGLTQYLLHALVFASFVFESIMALCLCSDFPLFGPEWHRFLVQALKVLTLPASFLFPPGPLGGNAVEAFPLVAANSLIWGTVLGLAISAALEMAERLSWSATNRVH